MTKVVTVGTAERRSKDWALGHDTIQTEDEEEPRRETEKEQLVQKEENQENVVSQKSKFKKGQEGEGNEQPCQTLV